MSTQKYKHIRSLFVVSFLLLALNIGLAFTYFINQSKNSEAKSNTGQVLGVNTSNPGYKRRFTTNTQGAIVFAGNAVTLSQQSSNNGSAGTFMSIDPNSVDGDYGLGTTSDWTQNATYFNLNLPTSSTVLYAELIWGGNQRFQNTDLTQYINNPIKFFTPNGQTTPIAPDPITHSTAIDNDNDFSNYVNSQNITSLVASSGSGRYGCGAIPAVIDNTNGDNNYAGCTLAIAYQDNNEVSRNLTIFVGSESVNSSSNVPSTIGQVTGFITPPTGQVTGKLFVSAQEGDSALVGDQMRFGQTVNSLNPISGPNNPATNFFASQINDMNGVLDTTGSFGDRNQSRNSTGIAKGLRHGWDITSMDISDSLTNSQTAAFAQGTSQGDGYLINALAIQIDIKSPRNIASLTGNQSIDFCVLQNITYTLRVRNNGTADSQNTIVQAAIPAGTQFVDGSITVDGQSVQGNIVSGVDIGTLKPNDPEKVITYVVRPLSAPQNINQYRSNARVNYDFQMFDDGELIQGSGTSNLATTSVNYNNCPGDNPNPPTNLPRDDEAITDINTPIIIDVVANDGNNQQFDFSCLRISSIPGHGRVEIIDGKIKYTPDPNYTGTDVFRYEICDVLGNRLSATVRVTVRPARRTPQVLGAFESRILPRSGGDLIFLTSLAILAFICIGFTIIPASIAEKKEKDDDRREF